MIYNLIRTKGNGSEQIASFGGLNRTDNAEKNEFSDMINLSSDKYPFLTPSKAAKNALEDSISGIRAVIAPQYSSSADITSFTGVAGDKFYYNGEEIDFEDAGMTIPDGDVTLVDFNGRIIICVYDGNKSHMLYYDYTATGADEQGRRYVRSMEQGVKNITCTAYSSGNPKEDFSVTNYLYSSGVTWPFKEGDSVFIEGFKNIENNTVQLDSRYQDVSPTRAISCIVEKVEGNRLYLQMYNRNGNALVFKGESNKSGVSVYTKIPTMNHVCIHNNRLWGTNPNGEYIYASKQGDCFNFNTFQGLANDSFYAEIGTAGGFVGIVSFRDTLVAFKRDYIHHIYGDKPSNFTIPKQLSDCGCIDIRSAAQVGTTMYFLGYGGIYAYVGGQPTLISKKLDRKYKSAVAMTDGQKYIVSCKDYEKDDKDENDKDENDKDENDKAKNDKKLLVLDTEHGLWHMEDYIDAVGSFRWHDKLYIASRDTVYEYGALSFNDDEYNREDKKEYDWACESVIIHDDIFDNKGMTELWIRARIDEGSEIKVLTSEDGGVFLDRGTLKGTGTLKVYRIPIRFINGEFYQYRLEGTGNAVIYSIERVLSSGGRQYRSI